MKVLVLLLVVAYLSTLAIYFYEVIRRYDL